MTTTDRLATQLRDRIRTAWEAGPLFIDPIVVPGLTARQRASLEAAVATAEESGIPVYVAVSPPTWLGAEEAWSRFTADLAFSMFESSNAEQAIVVFAETDGGARLLSYLVDDNGPAVPPGLDELPRSATDDFLPLELAVPYHLEILVAAATGAPPPSPLDFDPADAGEGGSRDYIEATGLDDASPDTLVLAASGLAALGLTAWVLSRRQKYAWRSQLTTDPELVRRHRLVPAVEKSQAELPVPQSTGDEVWALRDRGLRIQEAIAAIVAAHPDWAAHPDHSHRQAIFALTRSDKWVRSMLGRSTLPDPGEADERKSCYFFPAHAKPVSSYAMKQAGTVLTVNACATCIADFEAGHDPVCLMVPKDPKSPRSRAVPYFQRDDAYATSGFGSFVDLEVAILDYGVPGAAKRVPSEERS